MACKKYSLAVALAVVALILAATAPSYASLVTVSAGETVKLVYGGVAYREGSGGEFQVQSSGGTALFHTFCAEESEFIYDNELVKIASTSLQTVMSGKSLTFGAAKLFSDYYAGIAAHNYGFSTVGNASNNFLIDGLTFSLGGTNAERADDGAALQEALWAQLGWVNPLSLIGKAQTWYNYAQNINLTPSLQDANYWDVRIMNLTSLDGAARQDQFGVVPEANTIVIWSVLGLIGLVVMRRRRG